MPLLKATPSTLSTKSLKKFLPPHYHSKLTHITLPNPAGFEPGIHHVSNSGPPCRCAAFPHITCELAACDYM